MIIVTTPMLMTFQDISPFAFWLTMRLLNTESKRLEEFDANPPDYAILSHCWFKEEVSFQDMSRSDVEKMKGYAKLSAACNMAHHLGYPYLWMDTCCIDKSSSAELSEAINSMYSWYKSAGLCIAYLNDVDGDIKGSRWFKRGWTLQELIAPEDVIFADRNWDIVGMKSSLASLLANITGIDEDVLLTGNIEGLSIAKRMSWAANRDTTRREDRAYSLMGIFGVNMPPIYGEGDKAFIRLQEEIMKKSNDQSIFTWSWYVSLVRHLGCLWLANTRELALSGMVIWMGTVRRIWLSLRLVHRVSKR